jgi:Uma2 family endonuclease
MVTSRAATAESMQHTMTLEEWADLDEDEAGELVDGQMVEDEEVGAEHDIAGAWLVWTVRSWLASQGGFVGTSDTRFGVSVSPVRGRKPDVYVYLRGRKPPREGLVTIPPDIMIEVVSRRPKDARRDRVEKTNEYAAFGARFYWIVDPAIRTFEILELGADQRYAHAASAADGKIDHVPGCAGLVLDVDALWAELDRLEGEEAGGEG